MRDFSLELDDQLCFALYAASRAVTARYRPLLDDLGLTYPQYLVLLVLWERGPVPVKDVAAALQLDYGTLSPLLKRLESAGLILRERRPDDERSVRLVLTEAGDELRERAKDVPPAMGEAMNLGEEDTARLRALLRTLADNVSR
ncbi:DNA-binding MarR family transcriptional regulator [Saccharothrix carnea]|uniref:DNA-binding MarR family transcriptional regulator n=1 Tax=Saccharothrix carnea TaxID=1280637 RepID=A0A2P8I9T4_SACCR|nr:MarR family transcriptional regulator [Saccharothrix carnea]PSL55210.1 DNA-binding MarR family transcriptional regulator [Saccharothrix carnea]